MLLTQKTASALTLPNGKKDVIFFDDDIPGFGIRLREGGARNWVYQYRFGNKQRRVHLGNAKSVPLVTARRHAGEIEAKVRLGQDAAAQREMAKHDAGNTFGVLAEQYIEARKSQWRPNSEREAIRYLLDHAKPLHKMAISSVSQRDVAVLLSATANRVGDVTANRLRANLSAFFGWVIREGIRLPEGNVAAYTNKRAETARDRVLSDDELKTVWRALGNDDYAAIVRLLILTGQRANEIAGLQWSEIGDDAITLPGERTKNKRPHAIPLSDPAKAILAKFHAGNKYVFGRDDTGWQNWHKAKKALDAKLPIKPWTIHDLRRTCATHMAELGVQPHIIEAVLNHVSGAKRGVAGVYNRATYDREKREALNLWAEHVMALVEGRKSVVVPMKRA